MGAKPIFLISVPVSFEAEIISYYLTRVFKRDAVPLLSILPPLL